MTKKYDCSLLPPPGCGAYLLSDMTEHEPAPPLLIIEMGRAKYLFGQKIRKNLEP